MKIRTIKVIVGFLVVLLVFFGCLSLYYWNYLNIPNNTIKFKIQNISKDEYLFKFSTKNSNFHNIFIRVHSKEGRNYLDFIKNQKKYKIQFDLEISNSKGEVVKINTSDPNNNTFNIGSNSFDWYLLPNNTFKAQKNHLC